MKKKQKKDKDREEWKGFDDCVICQAMKKGKANTEEELIQLFKEAEKSGAHVGINDDFLKNDMPFMTMRTQNKNDLYYDAMDAIEIGDFESAEKFLNQAKEIDPEYIQTYVGFTHLYGNMGDKNKALENANLAFEKTVKIFPKWPKEMLWGDMDNRAYMRAIQYKADLCADNNEKEKAIELYKLLLKFNPNDNQGVRYSLAGLYSGIIGEKMGKMFDEGTAKQNWNKLEKMVSEQNKKYKFWKELKD